MHQSETKKGRKLLSLLCSLALTMALVPCVAFAAEDPLCSVEFDAPNTDAVGETAEVDVYLVGKKGEQVPACFQGTIEVSNGTINDITGIEAIEYFDANVATGKFSFYGLDAKYDTNGKYCIATLKFTPSEKGEAAITMKDVVAGTSGNPEDAAEGSVKSPEEPTVITVKPALTRLAGEDADQTAAAISDAGFESSEYAVLARMDDFADALGASGLAGTLNCPILLTDRENLSEAAAEELERLDVEKVYVIGGPGALFEQIDKDLSDIGVKSERVYGDYAWDTSLECAEMIEKLDGNEGSQAIVAMSSNFQDALSISTYAYKYKVPLILEDDSYGTTGKLTEEAIEFISDTTGTIFVPGGPGAVAKSTVEDVFAGRTIERIYGEDGYDTSNQIALYMVENDLLSANVVGMACGAQKAHGVDALAGAALVGGKGGVMLLVNAQESMETEDYTTIDQGKDSQGGNSFLAANKGDVQEAYVLGGSYVSPTAFFNKVADILGAAREE